MYCCSDSRRDLMHKIVAGKFEFVSPYWNEISDSAKVLIVNATLKLYRQCQVLQVSITSFLHFGL